MDLCIDDEQLLLEAEGDELDAIAEQILGNARNEPEVFKTWTIIIISPNFQILLKFFVVVIVVVVLLLWYYIVVVVVVVVVVVGGLVVVVVVLLLLMLLQ